MRKILSALFLFTFVCGFAYPTFLEPVNGYDCFEDNGLVFMVVEPYENGIYIINKVEANREIINNNTDPGNSFMEFAESPYEGEEIDLTGNFWNPFNNRHAKLIGVGYGAFANCKNLRIVLLPETIREISDGAFYGCERLANINIMEVDVIGEYAFANCKSFYDLSIKLNDAIKAHAFENSGLIDIEFMNTPGTLEAESFAGCPNLEAVRLSGRIPAMDNAFDSNFYTDGHLFVTLNIMDMIPQSEGWNRFKKVSSYSQLGVGAEKVGESVSFDGTTISAPGSRIVLYDITGREKASAMESLSVKGMSPGLYIVDTPAGKQKIVIR